jgi:hypothetical protein
VVAPYLKKVRGEALKRGKTTRENVKPQGNEVVLESDTRYCGFDIDRIG